MTNNFVDRAAPPPPFQSISHSKVRVPSSMFARRDSTNDAGNMERQKRVQKYNAIKLVHPQSKDTSQSAESLYMLGLDIATRRDPSAKALRNAWKQQIDEQSGRTLVSSVIEHQFLRDQSNSHSDRSHLKKDFVELNKQTCSTARRNSSIRRPSSSRPSTVGSSRDISFLDRPGSSSAASITSKSVLESTFSSSITRDPFSHLEKTVSRRTATAPSSSPVSVRSVPSAKDVPSTLHSYILSTNASASRQHASPLLASSASKTDTSSLHNNDCPTSSRSSTDTHSRNKSTKNQRLRGFVDARDIQFSPNSQTCSSQPRQIVLAVHKQSDFSR